MRLDHSRTTNVKAKRAGDSGFTLIEVMIGLVVLSIMMGLLFGSIRMGAQAWDKGEKTASEIDTMLVVENFLRTYLSTARPVYDDFTEEDEEAVFSFSGTEDSIQFVANLPVSARLGGLHQFNLEVERKGDSSVLIAKIKPFYPALNGDSAAIEDVRLLEGIDSIEWSYYALNEIGSFEGRWVDSWSDEYLPVSIQVRVRMKDGGEWPPLIVSPKLVGNDPGALYQRGGGSLKYPGSL